jgi:hypothetical protein
MTDFRIPAANSDRKARAVLIGAISRRRRLDVWLPGKAEVTKVDGRQIEFTVRANDGAKEIGVGSHSRVVIDVAKFTPARMSYA